MRTNPPGPPSHPDPRTWAPRTIPCDTSVATSDVTCHRAINELDGADELDAQAIFERTQKLQAELKGVNSDADGAALIGMAVSQRQRGRTAFIMAWAGTRSLPSARTRLPGMPTRASWRLVGASPRVRNINIHISGPLRAPTNVRSTIRWDYQPDICKASE